MKKPKVHKELEGLDLKIDTFGELSSNMNIDKINQFLNGKVDDLKLQDQKSTKKRTAKTQGK
jgi:hypothetical protein